MMKNYFLAIETSTGKNRSSFKPIELLKGKNTITK
jgi:hypothetical protein